MKEIKEGGRGGEEGGSSTWRLLVMSKILTLAAATPKGAKISATVWAVAVEGRLEAWRREPGPLMSARVNSFSARRKDREKGGEEPVEVVGKEKRRQEGSKERILLYIC